MFPNEGATDLSSSTSSLSSSPPNLDQLDLGGQSTVAKRAAPGLPDVQEHPTERVMDAGRQNMRTSFERILEEQADMSPAVKPDIMQEDDSWGSFGLRGDSSHPYQLENILADCFASDAEVTFGSGAKRRRSGSSALNSLTNRVITRFPSLSKRKGRKKPSAPCSEDNSGVSSPVQVRSRSNSRARSLSLFRRSEISDVDMDEAEDLVMTERFETIEENDQDNPADGLQPFQPVSNDNADAKRETLERVHTPLVPALMESPTSHEEVQTLGASSKLDDFDVSENYADPLNSIQATPQLSAQNSFSVLRQPHPQNDQRVNKVAPISDISEDAWSDRLGHANFTIIPKPYLPDQYNSQTCAALLSDWNRARCEYSRHLARTSKHFGQGSRTYRLTEEKWTEIDGQWRQHHDEARCMVSISEGSPPNSPSEPAPVVRIPSLDEKFPQLNDYDIVGPMERIAPPERSATQVRQPTSKKTGLMKILGGINRRARSASGPR